PVKKRLRERLLDFIAEPAVEAEVRRALALHVLRRCRDLLDEIAADQPAFDCDCEAGHQSFFLALSSAPRACQLASRPLRTLSPCGTPCGRGSPREARRGEGARASII